MLPEITPTVQIRNQSLVVYTKLPRRLKSPDFLFGAGVNKTTGEITERKKAYSGELTTGAIKRMTKAIHLLIASTPTQKIYSKVLDKNINHKLSFITLTIPAHETKTAKECHKQLLEPMLKHLRQVHGMRSYVWKVELQKRGQLHYHITSDVYIHYQELRNKWNQLLAKGGFMNEYIDEKSHTNANSTDIHSVRKVKDLASYLVKYFSKREQNATKLDGKLWDCSLNLKKANYYSTEFTEDLQYEASCHVQRKICTVFTADRFAIYKFRGIEPIRLFPTEVKEAYYKNLEAIRGYRRGLFECLQNQTKKQDSVQKTGQIKIVPKYYQLDLFQ